MTFIQRLDGELIDLEAIGIRTKDFIVSSPKYIHHTEAVEGGMGLIDYGSDILERDISVLFRLNAQSFQTYAYHRDRIFNLFESQESFYIIDRRVIGKRWLVKEAGSFSINQRGAYGDFEITFIGLKGVSESRATSMDVHNSDINSNDEIWSAGMGLIAEPESKMYKVLATSDKNFRIYNPGDVTVHAFMHELKMTIKNVVGSTNMFQITNLTNGSRSRVRVPIRNEQTIVYDGPNITRDGLSIFGETSRNYVELTPGWNTFRIYYCDRAEIEFDFRYYYK